MTASYGMSDAMHCWRCPPGTWGGGCPKWCGKCLACPTRRGARIRRFWVRCAEGQADDGCGPIAAQKTVNNIDLTPLLSAPLIVIAGQEYGTGSSRDWAAKGTNLLGVKVVVVQSFERIHCSNIVGMGVPPLQFKDGTTAQTLKLDGTETYDIVGPDANLVAARPRSRPARSRTCPSAAASIRPSRSTITSTAEFALCAAATGGECVTIFPFS